MKLPIFLFATLLAMCVVLGIAFVTPQVPFEEVVAADGTSSRVARNHGFAHPQYPTMDRGGPGALRHERTLWLGWAFVALNVLFFGACLLLGMRRYGRIGPTRIPILIGTAIFLLLFTALIFSYQSYMFEDAPRLFLSFPRPTAWMLLAIWPFPLFFMALYYVFFDRWYFTERDQKALDEIVARRRPPPAGGE